MAANAGERARETGDFRCQRCDDGARVTKGREIPRCQNCGDDTYDTREREPGRKSSGP